METKRCPRCNKLLRAEAENCSRCGISVSTNKGGRKLLVGQGDITHIPSQPTNPPASPHMAGHYSGLHPEDQPFQSSFFQRIQQPLPSIPDVFAAPVDEEDLFAPAMEEVEDDDAFDLALAERETLVPQIPRSLDIDGEEAATDSRAMAEIPTLSMPLPALKAKGAPRRRGGTIPISALIAASLISFLVASGLLTFLLLSKNTTPSVGPQLVAMPGALRVGDSLQLSGSGFRARSKITLIRDTNVTLLDTQAAGVVTDSHGAFQAHIPITATWKPGTHTINATDAARDSATTTITIQASSASPPQLRLAETRLDLGVGNPGAISQKNITLTNVGGGQINWQAKSSVSWLTLNPTNGTFAGSSLVTLTANRTNLAPRAYLGQVVFTPQQGSAQTLYVSMTVNTTPANLVLSTSTLAFTGTPVQSPSDQLITIQNDGGQRLNWTAGSTTTDGTGWLSITPATGWLNADTSAVLTVSVDTLKMTPGSYQGSLSFSYAGGPQQQLVVTLAVNPPPQPIISVTPASLNFTTDQGFNPAAQSFTLSNPGNAPLDWSMQEDQNGQLYLNITPTRGTLAAGQSINVAVAPTLGSTSGLINSMLTVIDSDQGTGVQSQQVRVAIAITSEPMITVLTGNLEFDHTSGAITTSQFIIFTNSGNLPLNWSLTVSPQVSWLTFDSSSGTLAAGGFAFVTVNCNSTNIKPGTYTVTVTLKDTDAHTVVAPQTFTIKLVVSG